MDEKLSVPYVVYEGEMARSERHVKRLTILLAVAVLLVVVTNAIWIYAWSAYEYADEHTVTIDSGEGIANYIGNDGSIVNGEDHSDASAREAP